VTSLRLVSSLLSILLLASIAPAAEDLLADLRAEVAAITATATLKSSVVAQGDGGPRYANSNLVLTGDMATYGLQYKSFLPPNEARNRAELNDWASGLGMTQPSTHGWYSNGFIEVRLADGQQTCSTSDTCGEPKLVQEQGKIVAADVDWQLPNGAVKLRFFILADRPELFLRVSAVPKSPPARLQLDFRCYPGGFVGPFDRRAHTALQEIRHTGTELATVPIDPVKEPWIIMADHYPGLTPRPMGPCTIAANPEGLQSAVVEIKGNYPVEPKYQTKPGALTATFVIREFTPTTWESARDEVAATTTDALQAAQTALAALPQ
jgi:hypothetical protein